PPSTSVLPPVGAGASRPLAPAPAGSSPVRTATSVAPPPTQATAVTPAPTTAVSATAPVHAPAATSTTTAPLLPHAVPSTSADQYVRACGVSLCLAGSPWRLYGATIYSGYDDPRGRISMAKAAGLNTLRLVNFIDPADSMADLAVPRNWARLDAAIADAQVGGLHVILDLSDYRNLLTMSGKNPYTVDWGPFLRLVAQRVNSVSGLRYADDPTIALISIAGEVEPVNSPKNTLGITTADVTTFFSRTFAEWRALDPHHLLSTGGLGQLDWPSGIDWRSIMALPGSDVCAIIAYGESTTSTIPATVGGYCASLGRPWITEEFGTPISLGDAARAAWYDHVIDENRSHGSAGTSFWNLGPQTISPSYDVNPESPLLWAAVRAAAP